MVGDSEGGRLSERLGRVTIMGSSPGEVESGLDVDPAGRLPRGQRHRWVGR